MCPLGGDGDGEGVGEDGCGGHGGSVTVVIIEDTSVTRVIKITVVTKSY